MPAFIDLSGIRFGRLTVLARSESKKNQTMWSVVCDCGKNSTVSSGNLRSGASTSCGCLHNEQLSSRNTKHGMSKHPLYPVWKTMNQRCRNKNTRHWEYYGARGINICDRWNPAAGGSFENFIKDMPEYPGKPYSIDRIDNDGNYCPENCRWATPQQQRLNQRKKVLSKSQLIT